MIKKIIEKVVMKVLLQNDCEEESMQNNNNNAVRHLFEVGKKYYCETYTKYYTFIFVGYAECGFAQVESQAWIADTGRYHETFSDTFNSNSFKEVEHVNLKGEKFLKIDAMINIMEIPVIITSSK